MARPKNKRAPSVAVTQYADGYWTGTIEVGRKPNGEPIRRRVRALTYDECADKIRELEDQIAAGKVSVSGRAPTVQTLLSDWLDQHVSGLEYHTISSYTIACDRHLIPRLCAIRLDALTQHQINAALTDIEATVSTHVAARCRRTIRAALSWAVRQGMIGHNVAKLTKPFVPREDEVVPFTPAQARAILAVVAKRRNGARWLIALMLGSRQGEALGLAWRRPDRPRLPGDVDLDAGTLTIREKQYRQTYRHGCADPHACGARLHRTQPCPPGCVRHTRACPPPCPADCVRHASSCPARSGGIVKGRTKTRAGDRTVAMPALLVDALREHKRRQDAERRRVGSKWVETGLVFTTEFGTPVDARRDWADFKAILAEAGVADARVHDARHTAATFLRLAGVDKRVVMAMLGWSTPAMADRYEHVVDEMQRDAAGRMDELLRPVIAPEPEPNGATILKFRPKAG